MALRSRRIPSSLTLPNIQYQKVHGLACPDGLANCSYHVGEGWLSVCSAPANAGIAAMERNRAVSLFIYYII